MMQTWVAKARAAAEMGRVEGGWGCTAGGQTRRIGWVAMMLTPEAQQVNLHLSTWCHRSDCHSTAKHDLEQHALHTWVAVARERAEVGWGLAAAARGRAVVGWGLAVAARERVEVGWGCNQVGRHAGRVSGH